MILAKGGIWRIEGEANREWRLYEHDRIIARDTNPVLLFRCFVGQIERTYWCSVKPALIELGYDPLFGSYGEWTPEKRDRTDLAEQAMLEQREREFTQSKNLRS